MNSKFHWHYISVWSIIGHSRAQCLAQMFVIRHLVSRVICHASCFNKAANKKTDINQNRVQISKPCLDKASYLKSDPSNFVPSQYCKLNVLVVMA